MFDKEKTGFIDVSDLQTIMKSLGRDPTEAVDLLDSLEMSQEGRISFEEFL
jgi:Ca2+-binding EF-hand superfamily protein